MSRGVGIGICCISSGMLCSREDYKESEHTKKVKDFERALKKRKKTFGVDSVGNPDDKPDPKHIIKKGKQLGGGEVEISQKEFIKAAAKDSMCVDIAKKVLKK